MFLLKVICYAAVLLQIDGIRKGDTRYTCSETAGIDPDQKNTGVVIRIIPAVKIPEYGLNLSGIIGIYHIGLIGEGVINF